MRVGETDLFRVTQSGLEHGTGFAGEADNKIGAEPGMGKAAAESGKPFDGFFEFFRRPVHAAEHVGRQALQAYMQVVAELFPLAGEREQVI